MHLGTYRFPQRHHFLPALIAGGSSLIGAGIDAASAAEDRAQNQLQWEGNRYDKYAMWEDQKRYQTEMANTAYQRQKADMEAAGINPMLAIMKGGGASSPTPSPSPNQGMSPVVNRPSVAQAMASAVSTAAQAAQVAQGISESGARERLALEEVNTEKTKQALNTSSAVAALKGSQLTSQKTEHLSAELRAVKQEAKLREKKAFIDEELAVPDAVLTRAQGFLSGLARIVTRGGGASAKQDGYDANESWKSRTRLPRR